jgi:ARG and Rhodanese-Phosphatase-superfamily-associated Protein domain
MRSYLKLATFLGVAAFFCFAAWNRADAGNPGPAGHPIPAGNINPSRYKVLAPISHGNLTIFPVVASNTYDTGRFLTLDEGLRTGEVVITEWSNVRGMVRPRHGHPYACPPNADCYVPPVRHAQVNSLALINNSDRPLLLLAGEIVTGGKQDRVIGKDRIVPPDSEPLDLNVFCVEPGRWTGATEQFGTVSKLAPMAQPAVRSKAMAEKDQQKVWDAVGSSRSAMVASIPGPPPAALAGGTSYAGAVNNEDVKKQLDTVVVPVEKSYENVLPQLRAQHAVGVVVAVNGEIIWADLFASTSLLEKYWPKLVRSYAAEAVTARRARYGTPSIGEAQQFLEDLDGTRQTVESEPGVYRHTEVWGRGFRAFELASLLPKTGFDVHISKMAN